MEPALDAARRALRQMDNDHVPPGLRAIAARSGKLPPPLGRRLVQELEQSEWLRAEAAAAWPSLDIDSPDPRLRASALFLLRPPGWEQLATVDEDTGLNPDTLATRKKTSELDRARRRIKRLENELAKAAKAQGDWEQVLESRLTEQSARLGRERQRQELESRQTQLAVADLQARLERAEEARLALVADLEKLRKKGSQEIAPPSPRRPLAWEARAPLELGRHLDDLAAAGAISPGPWLGEEPRDRGGSFSLPTGVRPDRAEAIEWLVSQTEGIVVAIDGWNAAHLLASPPAVAQRMRVIEAGRRIRAASKGRRRVLVVFDSQEGSEQLNNLEVEIVYVGSADDEILEMAQRATAPLLVISSDRRVREGAEAAGAVGLWSEALIDWLRHGGRRTFGA